MRKEGRDDRKAPFPPLRPEKPRERVSPCQCSSIALCRCSVRSDLLRLVLSHVGSVAHGPRLEGSLRRSDSTKLPLSCPPPAAASIVCCCRRTTNSPARSRAGDGRGWSRTTPQGRRGVGKKMPSAFRHAGRRVFPGSIQHCTSTKSYVHQPLKPGIRV